ncbi:DoxX family protein [Dokdonella sp.]|uniref:DoxX family protein n=1 Tax=Dokdonella sp. TaxID=2291710 RepID=UPI0037839097
MIDKLLDRHRDVVILLARVLLMALFVISGWSKLTDFAGTVAYMEYLKTPMPSVAAGIAVAMEVGVGIALLAGVWVRPLSLALAIFVAGAALIGHPFWSMIGAERALNLTHFLKDMSIMGGLLLLAITGGGRFALTKA